MVDLKKRKRPSLEEMLAVLEAQQNEPPPVEMLRPQLQRGMDAIKPYLSERHQNIDPVQLMAMVAPLMIPGGGGAARAGRGGSFFGAGNISTRPPLFGPGSAPPRGPTMPGQLAAEIPPSGSFFGAGNVSARPELFGGGVGSAQMPTSPGQMVPSPAGAVPQSPMSLMGGGGAPAAGVKTTPGFVRGPQPPPPPQMPNPDFSLRPPIRGGNPSAENWSSVGNKPNPDLFNEMTTLRPPAQPSPIESTFLPSPRTTPPDFSRPIPPPPKFPTEAQTLRPSAEIPTMPPQVQHGPFPPNSLRPPDLPGQAHGPFRRPDPGHIPTEVMPRPQAPQGGGFPWKPILAGLGLTGLAGATAYGLSGSGGGEPEGPPRGGGPPPPPMPPSQDLEGSYTVQPGNTLSGIAKKMMGSGLSPDTYAQIASALAQQNQIQDPSKISIGQKLSLPTNIESFSGPGFKPKDVIEMIQPEPRAFDEEGAEPDEKLADPEFLRRRKKDKFPPPPQAPSGFGYSGQGF